MVSLLKTGAKVLVGGLVIYSLASQNGMLDSPRTKEANQLQGDLSNLIKTVASVEEMWEDNKITSPTLDGYNPLLIREVTFKDGSQVTLKYRTHAWQPFMRWRNGDEFNPQPGERYEVTSSNVLVRRV